MGLSETEKQSFKDSIKEFVDSGRPLYDSLAILLSKTPYYGKITKSETSQIVNDIIPGTDDDYIRSINSEFSSKVRSGEAKARKELSGKALNAIVSATHDAVSSGFEINEAVKNGELSQEDIDTVKKTRDTIMLLTDMRMRDGRARDNIDLVKMASGRGFDPNASESADIRNQLAARIWNERLTEMSKFNYSKYARLSDEELVASWPEAYAAFEKIFNFASEMPFLRENPYIDTALIEKTFAAERKYTDQYGILSARMRCIASPYYSSIDYNILADADNETILDLCDIIEDKKCRDYVLGAKAVKDATANSLRDIINENLSNTFNVSTDNQRLFDKNGAVLDVWGVLDCARRGEDVYACDLSNARAIITLKLDEKKLSCTATQSRISEEIRQKLDTAIQNEGATHCAEYDLYVYSMNRAFTESASGLVKEILDKNLNYAKIKDRVLKHYRDEEPNDRSLSKTEYLNRLKKLGLDPKVLSDKETEERKQLTVRAHEKNIDLQLELSRSRGLSAKGKEKLESLQKYLNPRTLCAVAFIPKATDVAYNESVINRLAGTDEEKKQVVEEIYKRHLEKLNLFGKSYSDKELVDNWEELSREGVAVGMEFDKFNTFVKEQNIEIDKTLQKQMEDACAFVNASFTYYKARMDLIGSRYYKYGGEDAIKTIDQSTMLMQDLKDPEFRKSGITAMGLIQQTNFAAGYGLLLDKSLTDKKIKCAVDSEGNVYAAEDYTGTGSIIANGEPIYLIGDDNSINPAGMDMAAGLPPKYIQMPQPADNVRKCIELSIGMEQRVAGLRNGYEEQLAKDAVQKHIKLLNVMNNPKASNFNEKLKGAVADVCTSLALKEMAVGRNMPDDVLKNLSSDVTYKTLRKDILSSELAERMTEVIKNSPDKLHLLSDDDLFRTMVEIQANQHKEKVTRSESVRQKKYLKFRNESLDKANTINEAHRWADTINSDEYFFNGKVSSEDLKALHKETPLTGMSLERNSLKSLTMAMMLNQGYTPDQIFHPDYAKDRETVAAGAIAMVKAGDYSTIRENLCKGMSGLSDYISGKLDKMKDFSLSELVKPENMMLIPLNGFLKDMSQEYANCQETLPENLRLNIASTLAIQQRAENLDYAISKMNSKYPAKNSGFNEVSIAVKSYVVGECYNNYVKNLMNLPENRGKGAGKILENLYGGDFTTAYSTASVGMILDSSLNNKPETLRKIYDAIRDDTFKQSLNAEVHLPDAGHPELEFTFDLDNAIEKAAKRELMDKEIDPSLDVPVKCKDDLVMS